MSAPIATIRSFRSCRNRGAVFSFRFTGFTEARSTRALWAVPERVCGCHGRACHHSSEVQGGVRVPPHLEGCARCFRSRLVCRALIRRLGAHFHGTVVVEALKVRNMSASAKGTAIEPGRNVLQKAGLTAQSSIKDGHVRRVACLQVG